MEMAMLEEDEAAAGQGQYVPEPLSSSIATASLVPDSIGDSESYEEKEEGYGMDVEEERGNKPGSNLASSLAPADPENAPKFHVDLHSMGKLFLSKNMSIAFNFFGECRLDILWLFFVCFTLVLILSSLHLSLSLSLSLSIFSPPRFLPPSI